MNYKINSERNVFPKTVIDSQVGGNEELIKASSAINLHNLFVEELKDIYWAEKALVNQISKMILSATSNKLIETLTIHLQQTNEHVTRLEEVFSAIGKKVLAKKCEAIEGLIKETEGIMKETEKGMMRDEGIILVSQKIEHYQIATYGTLCSFARTLGENGIGILLQKTLDEEYEADEQLTEIALEMQSEIVDLKHLIILSYSLN